jgi:hypothetical protein
MHYDVIYVTLQEICPFENLVHDSLKEDRCILQSKRHHKPFPQLVASMDVVFLQSFAVSTIWLKPCLKSTIVKMFESLMLSNNSSGMGMGYIS